MRTPPLAVATLLALTLVVPAHAYAPIPPGRVLPTLGPKAPFVPGEVLVLAPRGGALAHAAAAGAARDGHIAALLEDAGVARVAPLGTDVRALDLRYDALRLTSDDPAFDPYAAARELVASGAAIAAAPNLRMTLHAVPNDPYLADQWHLSTSAAGVRARPAWDRSTGSASVKIGVMDTGVDRQHSDLFYKIWSNTAEISNNGIDDDHNGWIDDTQGWDFGDGDNDPDPALTPNYYGLDDGWHGTFVAGLAAAASNNGIGVAGVAWGCRIVPLKVADAYGDLTLAAIVDAFHYAQAVHVSVLNLSFGTSDPSAAEFFQELVTAATDAGIVVVASAGNSGVDTPSYPGACDDVLCVAATTASNLRASWSNWGEWVDIAAPGEAVWSSIARNYEYDELTWWYFETYCGFDGAHAYLANDGTSFASPIVAGAAALVRSAYPNLAARQVAQQLVVNGDLRAYDNPIGPRLNIERALLQPLAADGAAPTPAMAFAPPSPNPARSLARFAFTLPRAGAVRLELLDAQGRRVRTLLDGDAVAGLHELAWDLRDERGGAVAAGLYFARLAHAGVAETRRFVVTR